MKVEKKSGEAQRINARLLILEARFYAEMCDELAAGAIAGHRTCWSQVGPRRRAGALELPGAIAMAHHSGKYDGYVALGCVLRGETTHYDIVANESARGIMNLTLAGLCIGNGILTCENEAQAWARARCSEWTRRRCGRGGAGHDPAGAQPWRQEADSDQAKGQDQVTDRRRQKPIARSAARLGAVQALYQMDIGGTDVGETLAQFSSRVVGDDFDDGQCGEADYRHLKDVVDGVVREQPTIDPRSTGFWTSPGHSPPRCDSAGDPACRCL